MFSLSRLVWRYLECKLFESTALDLGREEDREDICLPWREASTLRYLLNIKHCITEFWIPPTNSYYRTTLTSYQILDETTSKSFFHFLNSYKPCKSLCQKEQLRKLQFKVLKELTRNFTREYKCQNKYTELFNKRLIVTSDTLMNETPTSLVSKHHIPGAVPPLLPHYFKKMF